MSLYVSTDFGATWKEAVQYVQMFDWGPHDQTVIYSAYEDDGNSHQFFRAPSDLNVYRSSDMLQTATSRLVVRHGVGFKVAKSGVYVAVKGEADTMQLFVSRDDAQSFLPAEFPSPLPETRYTILDEADGTVFVSVEHTRTSVGSEGQQDALNSGMLTIGDLCSPGPQPPSEHCRFSGVVVLVDAMRMRMHMQVRVGGRRGRAVQR